MAFKGEFKQLKDIEPGTPIELPDQEHYNSYYAGAKVGILESQGLYNGYARPVVLRSKSSGLDRATLPSMPEAIQTKVLTGKTREKLLEERRSAFLSGKVGTYNVGVLSGCDPEVFVVHGDGKLFPAFEFLNSKTGSVGWDGFQAEIRPSAQGCLMQLGTGIYNCLQALLDSAREKDPKARLVLDSVIEVPQELRNKATNEQVALNCAPSNNAYGLVSSPISDPRYMPLRFAAGHIHSGTTFLRKPASFTPILDAIFGVACVSLAEGMDSPERRRFYGLAGEHRVPPDSSGYNRYEYRVPSNFWLRHPAIYHLTFELYRATLRFALSNLDSCWNAKREEVIEAINNCDVQRARAILSRNSDVLAALVRSIANFNDSQVQKRAINTIMTGAQNVCSNDIERNWHLTDRLFAQPNQKGQRDHYWAAFVLATK